MRDIGRVKIAKTEGIPATRMRSVLANDCVQVGRENVRF